MKMTDKIHKHAPWRKSILVPFWTLQLFFELIIVALLTLAIGVLVTNDDNLSEEGFSPESVSRTAKIIVPIWTSLSVICMILTVTEIILLARHKLKPLFFLISNVIKSAIWTPLFILDILSAVSAGGRTSTVSGTIISIILLLSFYGPLIYGAGIYHRFRRDKKTYARVDPTQDSTYPSPYGHFVTIGATTDVEAGGYPGVGQSPSYHHGSESKYTPYNPRKEVQGEYSGWRAVGHTFGGSSPPSYQNTPLMEVPQVFVEQYDEQIVELDGRRRLT